MTDQPFRQAGPYGPGPQSESVALPRPGFAPETWLADWRRRLPGAIAKGRQDAAIYLFEFCRELPRAFRREWLLLAIILLYTVVGAVLAVHFEAVSILSVGLYYGVYSFVLPPTFFLIIASRALYFALIVRPQRPFAMLVADLRRNIAMPQRLAQAVPMLCFVPLLVGTFSVFKAAIPLIHAFSWDPRFEQWDRWLHGGVAPWELLQPILGYPLVSFLINVCYNGWFFVLWFACIWQFFTLRAPQRRMQFLLSTMLSWILIGSVLATFFSSAGPCYFGRIESGLDPYQPLIAYLHQANESYPLWALDTQQMLWDGYSLGRLNLGAGISAMPSMHVAIATLLALLGWQTSRRLGIALAAFLLLIMVGSVHLGWHYALDGYVSIACAALIWWATGWFVRRFMKLPASQEI